MTLSLPPSLFYSRRSAGYQHI